VGLDRLVAQDEPARDLPVRESLGDEAEDLGLARRERRERLGLDLPRLQACELGDQAPGDRRREERVAPRGSRGQRAEGIPGEWLLFAVAG
jgi:hypothetical protein